MTKKWDVLLWFALLSSALWGVVGWSRDLIPANVVLIPAALVEAKATGASGSSLPSSVVRQGDNRAYIKSSKASLCFVGLTDPIQLQDPEVCLQSGGPEPNHFPLLT